jgi:hypothetical protein
MVWQFKKPKFEVFFDGGLLPLTVNSQRSEDIAPYHLGGLAVHKKVCD